MWDETYPLDFTVPSARLRSQATQQSRAGAKNDTRKALRSRRTRSYCSTGGHAWGARAGAPPPGGTRSTGESVQALIFNILEQTASRTGCDEEAWELVMEFAAAEATLRDEGVPWGQGVDEVRLGQLRYQAAARTLLQCLTLPTIDDETDPDLDGLPEDLAHRSWFGAAAPPDAEDDDWDPWSLAFPFGPTKSSS